MNENQDEFKKALNLFNEKAEKLFRLSFVETMTKMKTGFTLSWQSREDGLYDESHERTCPNEEAIDAFVLTFRYFIQNNEITSFRQMANHYANASIDVSFKNEYMEIRRQVNDFLDSPIDFHFTNNDDTISRRELMEVFMYGGTSHANDSKKEVYDEWMSNTIKRPIAEHTFVFIISTIFKAISMIAKLNSRVLEELKS